MESTGADCHCKRKLDADQNRRFVHASDHCVGYDEKLMAKCKVHGARSKKHNDNCVFECYITLGKFKWVSYFWGETEMEMPDCSSRCGCKKFRCEECVLENARNNKDRLIITRTFELNRDKLSTYRLFYNNKTNWPTRNIAFLRELEISRVEWLKRRRERYKRDLAPMGDLAAVIVQYV
jgi:hypothetical protein